MSAKTATPITAKQAAWLPTLLAERDATGIVIPDINALSAKQASNLIDLLLSRPRLAPAKPKPVLPEVPAGRYAVPVEGVLGFYVVDRPEKGRWEGYTFVKKMASDNEYPVRGAGARKVLELIALDPKTASKTYGIELGVCGVCGRTLTDEESRAAGIGPVCIAKMGW